MVLFWWPLSVATATADVRVANFRDWFLERRQSQKKKNENKSYVSEKHGTA